MATPETPIVHVGLTHKCESRCQKCFIWKNPQDEPELGADKWIEILSQVGPLFPGAKVILTGGEPLLAREFFDLFKRANALGGIEVSLNSSAYMIDEEVADRLVDGGLEEIGITLDGIGEAHDRMKGVPGAYERTVRAIELLKERDPKIRIVLRFLLSALSIEGAPDFVRRFGGDPNITAITFGCIFQPFPARHEEGWHVGHPLWPDPDVAARVLDEVIDLQHNGYNVGGRASQFLAFKEYFRDPTAAPVEDCPAGRVFFTIDPAGNVSMCPEEMPVGNAKTQSLASIFNSDKARKARLRIWLCRWRFCHVALNARTVPKEE